MIGDAIQSDTLKALVSQHSIRDGAVDRVAADDAKWTLSIRLGGPAARLMPVRSRREPLRTWAITTSFNAGRSYCRLYAPVARQSSQLEQPPVLVTDRACVTALARSEVLV